MKNGDFVRVNLTGKLPDGPQFDTTDEPLLVCIGQGMVLPGIDKALIGKKPGTFTLTLTPEEAYGKKDPKKLQIIPTEQLKKQGINPQVGMQLTIDNQYALVKRSGGGRTVVDFNHPLSGKDVVYTVDVIEHVTDVQECVQALVAPLGIPKEAVTVSEDAVTLALPAVPPQPIMDLLHEKITQLTSAKKVHFEQGKK